MSEELELQNNLMNKYLDKLSEYKFITLVDSVYNLGVLIVFIKIHYTSSSNEYSVVTTVKNPVTDTVKLKINKFDTFVDALAFVSTNIDDHFTSLIIN